MTSRRFATGSCAKSRYSQRTIVEMTAIRVQKILSNKIYNPSAERNYNARNYQNAGSFNPIIFFFFFNGSSFL